jgi:hypothetical protein
MQVFQNSHPDTSSTCIGFHECYSEKMEVRTDLNWLEDDLGSLCTVTGIAISVMRFDLFLLFGVGLGSDNPLVRRTVLTTAGLDMPSDAGVDHHLEDVILVVQIVILNVTRQAVGAEIKVVALQSTCFVISNQAKETSAITSDSHQCI